MTPASSAMTSSLSVKAASLGEHSDRFVISAFDSALPYLASIGSGAQWGSIPFSEKPNSVQEMHDFCARSDRVFAHEAALVQDRGLTEAEATRTTVDVFPHAEWSRLLVAHVQVSADAVGEQASPAGSVPVAAAGISLHAPEYVVVTMPHIFSSSTSATVTGESSAGFAYLNYLIVHRTPIQYAISATPGSSDEDAAQSQSQRLKDHIANQAALSKGAGSLLIAHAKALTHALGLHTLFVDCWDGNGGQLVSYYVRNGFVDVGPFEVFDKHGTGTIWTGRLLKMNV